MRGEHGMELVIKIPDYNLDDVQNGSIACGQILKAVRNGTPLPKGHGDLVDIRALKGELWWVSDCPHIKLNEQALEIWETIEKAPSIIPAEKGKE